MSAKRGERRLRVAIEVHARAVRVVGLSLIAGPAVQRPSLEEPWIAQVVVAGHEALLQAFADPLLVRGARPRDGGGHRFERRDQGLVHVDVPLPADTIPKSMMIRLVDLSKVGSRAVDPAGVSALLGAVTPAGRTVGELGPADLARHSDWAALGLPAVLDAPGKGFEIYLDHAGVYRWRLRRPDGEIVADSRQGYRTRAACEADLRWIKQHAAVVPTRSLDTP
jgi:uncharacterized protein YegP (UPF0339 family)